MSMTELQAAKLIAETAEITARTARAAVVAAQADRRLELREEQMRLATDLARVELRKSELSTKYEEIALRKSARDEQLLLTDWRYCNTLNFIGTVDRGSVTTAVDKLHQYSVTNPGCDIEIVFNSPGGSVIDGMMLFDYIRFLRGAGHKVTIVALGYAASMAGILLQAADVRVMAKGSWLLIHEVSFSAGGKISEVEDEYKFGLRLKEQAAQIFVERSGGKLTREALELMWNRKDCWLDPDESLRLGLIDEVR
jgi:ATP-dependent Clp endopeptidase proteolytic subunit ClpP